MTKAAHALHATQPAVSLAIKELEQHYRTPLFERMNRRVYLTQAGEALYTLAQQILGGFEEAEERLRQEPYRLRVGANVSFGSTRLPGLLARFGREHPQVELSALVANSQEIQGALGENRLDVAVVDGFGLSPRLRTQALFQEELLPMASPALAPCPHTLEELCALPLLLREPGSGMRRAVEAALEGRSPRPFLESASTAALVEAARAGLGVVFLPRPQAQGERALVPLQVPGARFFRQYRWAVHRQKAFSPPLEDFLRLLRETCP